MTPHTVPHTVRAHNRRVDPVLCLLGAAATVTEGERRPLRVRPKALALLVRLALVAGLQDRAELAELLFAEANDPRDSLRWHLSHLRKQLPASVRDGFAGEGGSISLDVPTDAGIFRANVARVMRDPAVPDAPRVLGLYRGSLCSGLSVNASAEFDNWLYVQEDELRRRFRGATVAFARHAIGDGRGQDAVEPLRRLVAVDPYHEDAHVLLIDGLDAAGRTDEARHAYDRYERIVRDELHAEPRPELVRRYESRRPAGRALPLSELVPLRDVTMHVVEWPGPDPPIVAIHGSLGHAWRMSPVGESLASAARLIAVDLRGHGFSDKPPSGYRLHNHLHDLRQLIATLRLDHPILFGFSIGGAIATFLAADDDVGSAGLVLYDAVVGDRGFVEGASVVVERLGPELDRRYVGFHQYLAWWQLPGTGDEWERWIERSCRYDLAPLSDGTFRRRGLRDALEDEWRSVARADSLAALREVTCPVLIVHATQPWMDGRPYVSAETIDAQLEAAPHARLVVAGESHHADLIRHPEPLVVDAIVEFARSVRSYTSPRG